MKKLSEEKRLEGERPLMSETFLRTQDEDTERTGTSAEFSNKESENGSNV